MCYFVSIGARAPARLCAEAFDEQADFDVAASPLSGPIAKAFPVDDEVCLVTWRGCSCDLLGPSERTTAVVGSLATAFQRAVVRIASRLGSVRLLVHRHRERCLPAPSGVHLTLTLHEFMTREHWFVEGAVMEISESRRPSQPAFS